MKVFIPPIKSQGIKSKLVPWISSVVPNDFKGRWVEPFMGTGVVAFNIAPDNALMCDANPHLIHFYKALKDQTITVNQIRAFLVHEGELLRTKGEEHYYSIRERFNRDHDPLDFLFLNRAGFNGMIRFNRKGGFNIPFCRKPERFAQAYVTKIVNQADYVAKLFQRKNYEFKCQDFSKTIEESTSDDIVYCDPPYIDRYADYYNGWDETNEQNLFKKLGDGQSRFILSTWHHNDYRSNTYIETLWNSYNVMTREHFYHVGGSEKNRNPMIEALITNFEVENKLALNKVLVQQNLFKELAI